MRELITILLITCCSISVVAGLFWYSKRDESKANGFTRKSPPHLVSDLKEFDLGVNSFYIAGFSSDSIYLGNYTVFNRIVAVDKQLTDSTRHYIDIPVEDTLWGAINLYVDSPVVYITQTTRPAIRLSTFSNNKPVLRKLRTMGILSVQPVSHSTVIGKSFDAASNEIFFFRENTEDSTLDKKIRLGKTKEGIFYSDGMIAMQSDNGAWFYTYFYENRFVRLDTNLNVLDEGRTIDTFSVADISLARSKNNTNLSFSSSPRIVNKICFASDSLLFVYSGVKANNESVASFKESMAIDVYFASSGNYLFSFYLPYHNGHKCSSMQVHNNHIYAIYDRYLVSFKLNLHNFRGTFR